MLVTIGLVEALEAQDCNSGRLVKDPVNAYGGANDLKGDSSSNLSDMVFGLQFLFLGGPPPCPLLLSDLVSRLLELE